MPSIHDVASLVNSLGVLVGALAALVGSHLATRKNDKAQADATDTAVRAAVREELASALAPLTARVERIERQVFSSAPSAPALVGMSPAASRG